MISVLEKLVYVNNLLQFPWAEPCGPYGPQVSELYFFGVFHATTVMTLEQSAPHSEKDIKIPDVCDQFKVAWVNTFDMLESLRIRFDFREDLVAT